MHLPSPSTKACSYGLLALVAAVLFLVAIDGDVYAATVRVPHFAWQQVGPLLHSLPLPLKTFLRAALEDAGWRPRFLARKAYSIAAFAAVGLLIALARRERTRATQLRSAALWTTILSIVIELVQRLTGSGESFRSNILDVLSGTLGGASGGLLLALCGFPRKLFRASERSYPPRDSLHARRG